MKWIFRIAMTLTILVVVGVVALLLVPAEKVAQLATDRLEAMTGRQVVISGDVKATLWPRLGVRAEGIKIANAAWSDKGPLLKADRLDVGVGLQGLLGGKVAVEDLTLAGAVVLLERQADGTGNWEMGVAPPGQPGAGVATTPSDSAPPQVTVDRAALSGADITFIDHGADQTWRLRAVDVVAGLPKADGPLEIEGSALVNGQAITLAARVQDPLGLTRGTLTPLRVALKAGGTSATLDGNLDLDPLAFRGTLDASTTDRAKILTAFGEQALDLPSGLGRDRVALTSQLTLAPEGSLHLRDMALSLDQNRLAGAVDLLPGEVRPKITANLTAGALDLTALSQEGQGGETALVAETGWGQDVIDVSSLFLADAEVTFTSGAITLGDATLDSVTLRTVNDNGRMVTTLDPITAYGGTVTGDVVVNGRGGLSARVNLDLAGLQMQPFLTEFADYDRLIGTSDVTIRLLGVGDTAQALVESLGGSVGFQVGQGELLGLDIPGMVRSLDVSYRGQGQKTVFDSISARFNVEGGVARGDDLVMEAPLARARGAGTVSLGPQTLNYRLMATLRRNRESGGLTVPILISGPWSNPRIRPDLDFLEDLAKRRLEEERRALEAKRDELETRARAEAEEARRKAEAEARQRLASELDVQLEDIESTQAIEDAIKDRVEEQLLDLLLDR
ncbi:MAG: AsmA family protein [Pseudomonadota bacterium]